MDLLSSEYKQWLIAIKSKIRSTQLKAAVAVNATLIRFYWELGRAISDKQTEWGTQFLKTLSKDLQSEFPEMKGFSLTNLKYCRQFYHFFKIPQNKSFPKSPQAEGKLNHSKLLISPQAGGLLEDINSIRPQTVEELDTTYITSIPWGHIKLIINKISIRTEADFYIEQTIENNWSRDVLDCQIKSKLYQRKGNSITNFKSTLPKPFSDLADQTLKDPYIFDFLSLDATYRERDIENQLIQHITKFLLELGKGFAFIGNQYHLEIGESDYYLDLLFYHTKLKCYVVIELKNTKFIPEFAGKLNFYLSAVDSLIKDDSDNPTIGILLCKDKNNIEAEFALRDMNKPMGISEIIFVDSLPDNLKSSLPTINEIESELKKMDD